VIWRFHIGHNTITRHFTTSVKLWLLIALGIVLFLIGIALVLSDPNFTWQLLERSTGVIAIFAAGVAFWSAVRAANINARAVRDQAQANFNYNRLRDEALRYGEMLSIAIAIYSEILSLRDEVAHIALIIAGVENSGDDVDAQFLEDFKLSEPIIYPALAEKLGVLPPELLINIAKFYTDFQRANAGLPLLVTKPRSVGRGMVKSPVPSRFHVSTVLEPAIAAVFDVKPALNRIEVLAELSPAKDPDVGLACAIVSGWRERWDKERFP
jgi:hypothetical protein